MSNVINPKSQVESTKKAKAPKSNLESLNESSKNGILPWREWILKFLEIVLPYATISLLALLVFFKFAGCSLKICTCKCAEVKQEMSNSENTPNTNVPSETKQESKK